jgi:hypothetical protein
VAFTLGPVASDRVRRVVGTCCFCRMSSSSTCSTAAKLFVFSMKVAVASRQVVREVALCNYDGYALLVGMWEKQTEGQSLKGPELACAQIPSMNHHGHKEGRSCLMHCNLQRNP